MTLSLRGLRVTYPGPPPVRALDGVDLTLERGECVGVLGESGSGKSSLALALLGLLPSAQVHGTMRLDDTDLHRLDERGWRSVRWQRIALAFQSAAALNPVLRVVDQVAEPLELHLGLRRGAARERACAALEAVGLDAGEARAYPGELSGGQRRLCLLATAACCEPDVLVLDEPTAGLDPVTRGRVIAYLAELRERLGTTILLLGHDVDALAASADRVAILYRGWLAELGSAATVLSAPRHPYSRGLLDARPTLGTVKELRGIRGRPPLPTEAAVGCPFRERCTQAIPGCAEERPALRPPDGELDGRVVACLRGGLVTVLRARGLGKSYAARGRKVRAVAGISLELREGEVLGIAGTTGAGKSTLAQLLVGLLAPDEGSVAFQGLALDDPAQLAAARRRLQLVFQDPFEALSPRLTVLDAVREPLDIQGVARADGERHARAALDEARLPDDDGFVCRHTHELSGGQLQRVVLARALVLDPKVLVLDEPASMLDPSEQAELLQLLKRLQVERGLAMVLVSHDLAALLRFADRVLVLDGGSVVEEGTGTRLLVSPGHRVTRDLLSAAGRDALFSPSHDPTGEANVSFAPRPQEVRS